MFRVQGALAMFINSFLRQQATNGIVCQWSDFVDFVRGTEAIKEMNEWHATLQRGDM